MKHKDIYSGNIYLRNNPTLHEEDSLWKVKKLKPYLDMFMKYQLHKSINILDVGGGAGVVLKGASDYLIDKYRVNIKKNLLDLSSVMLEIQTRNNPDAKIIINSDIEKTPIKNKEIDLLLMIDVLEHIPHPEKAMREIRRIAKYAIFKVPLEDNLIIKMLNFLSRGDFKKQKTVGILGHINCYNITSLTKQITQNLGEILCFSYTNAPEYFLQSPDYKKKNTIIHKCVFFLATIMFKMSPEICAKIFNDFVIILVKCDDNL